jgi:hypothetical protein
LATVNALSDQRDPNECSRNRRRFHPRRASLRHAYPDWRSLLLPARAGALPLLLGIAAASHWATTDCPSAGNSRTPPGTRYTPESPTSYSCPNEYSTGSVVRAVRQRQACIPQHVIALYREQHFATNRKSVQGSAMRLAVRPNHMHRRSLHDGTDDCALVRRQGARPASRSRCCLSAAMTRRPESCSLRKPTSRPPCSHGTRANPPARSSNNLVSWPPTVR